ncbi:hypothetical protein [Nostoc sp. ChiQUE01b]|uniref:hypothetical protein n=1 Tax=Nostoc sp. ChiQUE01b TaxID=3075376 RepID=UPI002AD1D876|nr:hypothetical protein [Nostoc sp. ChiQUE01b]MDZ8260549.1 hypothetical protein [Nostoc sp. ChiQUE01b]
MIISDLNYLENTSEEIVGGANKAFADALANAYGNNTYTSTYTFAVTTNNSSASGSSSTAITY